MMEVSGLSKDVMKSKIYIQRSTNKPNFNKTFSKTIYQVNLCKMYGIQEGFVINFQFSIHKVLSLLEACFDLILGSLLHMKIQIMGGKIMKPGVQIPALEDQKNVTAFFFSFSNSPKQICISLFLTILEYLVLQIRHQ